MRRSRRIALLLAIVALALPAAPAHAGAWTSTTNSVAVYQYNVHQYHEDWIGWIQAVRDDPSAPLPDIVLGQDFESPVKVIDFKNQLTWTLGTTYAYAYSDNPTGTKGTTRAIFWRTARFALLDERQWLGDGGTSVADCMDSTHDNNAHAIQVKLDDLTNNKVVSAVSMKTPGLGTDVTCVWQNMKRATNQLAESGWAGDLHLIGTDTNAPDWGGTSYHCWWKGSVVPGGTGQTCDGLDLGWSDVIYDLCNGVRSTCLDQHWTHKNNATLETTRIDYIFAKRGTTAGAVSTSQATIDKGVCATYSDHCSVRALVSYGTTF